MKDDLICILGKFIFVILMIAIFMGYYFILSIVPLIFGFSYYEVISELRWFITYSALFGWWLTWVTIDDNVPY